MASKKVLLIEDSKEDRAIIGDMLKEEDVDVDVATSGEEGLKKILATKPNLVLLDLNLPGVGGFEICSWVKNESSLTHTKVVVLSVRDNMEDIEKALSVGADDYIIKLPRPEFLVKKIRFYLGL